MSQPPMAPIREATNESWDNEWDSQIHTVKSINPDVYSRRASQTLPQQQQQQQKQQGGSDETSPEFKMSKIQGFTLGI